MLRCQRSAVGIGHNLAVEVRIREDVDFDRGSLHDVIRHFYAADVDDSVGLCVEFVCSQTARHREGVGYLIQVEAPAADLCFALVRAKDA